MIHAALLALPLLFAAGGDTPIEPITYDETLDTLSSPSADAVCQQVADTAGAFDSLGSLAGDPTIGDFLYDMAVGYFIQSAQNGVGPSAAFTVEGELLFITWLDACSGHTYEAPTVTP
jgi:hypothetical protein